MPALHLHLTQYSAAPHRGIHRLPQFIFSYIQYMKPVELLWDNMYTYSLDIKYNKFPSCDKLHYNSILIIELLIQSSPQKVQTTISFCKNISQTTPQNLEKQLFLSPKIYPKIFRSKVKSNNIQFLLQQHAHLMNLQY